jgi:hypothetical protein
MKQNPPERPYVARVTGNLKRGAFDVEIGLKTLIVGPSLSGKTSILNNIEHALCGGCSDVMGREWTTEKGMLLALAPSATEAPASQVTLSNGSIMANGNANPLPIFPINQLLEKLRGTSEVFRRDVLGPATEDQIDESAVLRKLSTEGGRYWLDTRKASRGSLASLTESISEAKVSIRSRESQIKGVETSIRTVQAVRSPAVAPAMGDLRQLEADHATASAQAVQEAAQTQADLERYQRDTRAATQARAEWTAEKAKRVAALQAATNDLQARRQQHRPDASRLERIKAVGTIAAHMESTGATTCGVCAGPLPAGRAAAVSAQVRMILASLTTEDAPAVHEAAETVRAAQEAVNEADRVIAQCIAAEQAVPRPTTFTSAATRRDQIAFAIETHKRVVAAAAQAQVDDTETTRRALTDQIQEMQRHIDGLTRYVEEATRAAKELADEQVQRFLAAVQSKFPNTIGTFKLDLSGHTVRWGLERDGRLHTALSGAETAMVATALAAAISSLRAPPLVCRPILVPPDRQFDAATLGAFMSSIESTDAQVIILSTVRPVGRPRAGWTYVDLSDGPKGGGKRKAEDAELPVVPVIAPAAEPAPVANVHPLLSEAPPGMSAAHAFASSEDWPTAWAAVHGDADPSFTVAVEAGGALVVRHDNGAVSKLDDTGAVVLAAGYDGPVGATWRDAA